MTYNPIHKYGSRSKLAGAAIVIQHRDTGAILLKADGNGRRPRPGDHYAIVTASVDGWPTYFYNLERGPA